MMNLGKARLSAVRFPPKRHGRGQRGGVSSVHFNSGVFWRGVLLSGTLFYRLKLKHPIQKLQAGAQRIMEQDLDFVLEAEGKDELESLWRRL